MTQPHAKPLAFAALHHRGYRFYFAFSALAMMADSIEHVISYWMIFQKFHSPALGGYAIVSHWLPSLFFGVYFGALADRRDPRRMIQLGMVLFMSASIAWSILFLTGALEMWHAAVILTVHGFAGVLWGPAGQLIIHDIVGLDKLASAVRLNSTSRYLGMVAGPGVGAGFLLLFGPAYGILLNALIYLPLILWLWKAPYGPRFRKDQAAPRAAMRGFSDILATIRSIRNSKVIVAMSLLVGSASFMIGNSYQPQMPGFAQDLGHGNAGFLYSLLVGADAAGALTGGIVLEAAGLLPPRPTTAVILVMLWCCALTGFASAGTYPLALAFLFAAGFLELSFYSMAQTLVQLHAPPPIRGSVLGFYNMAGMGLRTFGGITVGVGGGLIGIHWSLSLSAAILFAIMLWLLISLRPGRAAAA